MMIDYFASFLSGGRVMVCNVDTETKAITYSEFDPMSITDEMRAHFDAIIDLVSAGQSTRGNVRAALEFRWNQRDSDDR